MSTRTSTQASTISSFQKTQQQSQEPPKPFNKRPAKSDHVQATPAKVRKLSQSDSAARWVPVGTPLSPGKSLASVRKRRQKCVPPGKASPVVVVPAKRSRRKVRFSEQVPMHIGHGSPGDQTRGNGQTSDDTVDVVVQMPSVAEATGDKSSNGPRREPDTTAEEGDEETDIFATHVGRGQVPTRDQDAAFRARYAEIKRLAWTWVQKHFPAVDPGAKRRLDLLRLAHTSPQLMEYANWVSCCGQKRTWEGVFAEQRAQLVYGMLGKVLEVHVFGHEMFGADREQLRELRELDMELLNKDGFYRQLCRAHKILAFLPDPNTPPPYFHHSLTDLCASFMELLSPLLPEPEPPELQPQLLTVLLKAATLSLSMRRERKVVYHWETHPAVGSLFEEKSMHILNDTEHGEEDDFRRNTDVEVVTMAGWPSCVAYRPNADAGHKEGGQLKKQKEGKMAKLGINSIGEAEVCVTFGPAIKPLSNEPENWLGKSLRVEMTERQEVKSAKDRNATIARRAAGLGVTVLGLGYVVGNPWILEAAKGYLGSFV